MSGNLSNNSSRSSNSCSERRSKQEGFFPNEAIFCKCGLELPVMTSWTDNNPGRRFRACPNYGNSSYCGVFLWWDPEMCSRSKQIIPGLLRRLNKLDDELKRSKEKEENLQEEIKQCKEREEALEHSCCLYRKKMRKYEKMQASSDESRRKEKFRYIYSFLLGMCITILISMLSFKKEIRQLQLSP